jgi:hypothetical protein
MRNPAVVLDNDIPEPVRITIVSNLNRWVTDMVKVFKQYRTNAFNLTVEGVRLRVVYVTATNRIVVWATHV